MNEAIARLGLIDEEAIALDIAALDIAGPDHPDQSLLPSMALLDEIATLVREHGARAASGYDRAKALADIIHGSYGFVGDRESYGDPANADFVRVLDRRRGLPVSLAILYVAIARRLGWQADPLDVPTHVLIRVGIDDLYVVVDPFAGGSVVRQSDAMAELARMLGGAKIGPEHFAPMSNRAVLVRLLLNQASRAEQAGELPRAHALHRRITLFAPGYTQAWSDIARLDVAFGDFAAARRSLGAMLETTRDPAKRAEIREVLLALAGR